MTAPHTVLGIRADATQDEIRAAWRALVRRAHPDLLGRSVSADERMKAINAAHDAMLEALIRAKRTAVETRRKRTASGPRPSRNPDARTASSGPPKDRGPANSAYPPRPCPPPERPFAAPRRMVPCAATLMKMRAALVRGLRREIDRETARLGGAAYTVPGQPGWRDDGTVMERGGLPGSHLVTRVDFLGRTMRLTLDAAPRPGPVLIALPRLRQTAPGRIERDVAATLLELELPDPLPATVRLSADAATRCVEGASDLTVEIAFPTPA